MSKTIYALFAVFLFCIGFVIYAEQTGKMGPASDSLVPAEETEEPAEASSVREETRKRQEEKLDENEVIETLQNVRPLEQDGIMAPVIKGEYQVFQENLRSQILNDTETGFAPTVDEAPPNHELQFYIPQQVDFEGGHIRLTADLINEQYVSGKAESAYAFRYGTFAYRVNVMQGTGLFPAIWMLPADGENFPEIDIYEMVGNHPENLYGVMHYMNADTGKKDRDFFKYSLRQAVPESYTIRFEWTQEEMVWYLNDQELYTIDHNVPQNPMYMILNLAVGGDWPGTPGSETVFPACFDVELLEFHPEEIFAR